MNFRVYIAKSDDVHGRLYLRKWSWPVRKTDFMYIWDPHSLCYVSVLYMKQVCQLGQRTSLKSRTLIDMVTFFYHILQET